MVSIRTWSLSECWLVTSQMSLCLILTPFDISVRIQWTSKRLPWVTVSNSSIALEVQKKRKLWITYKVYVNDPSLVLLHHAFVFSHDHTVAWLWPHHDRVIKDYNWKCYAYLCKFARPCGPYQSLGMFSLWQTDRAAAGLSIDPGVWTAVWSLL
jgi:hypothetical protein